MAKKDKLTLDDYNVDDELDFGDFNSFAEVDSQVNSELKSKKRTPVTDVFKGTISGAQDKLKDPAFLAKSLKDSLPQSYGIVFDTADKIGSTVTSLYDESVRELKPQLAKIAKKVNTITPDNKGAIKKFTRRMEEFFSDGVSSYNAPSKEQIQETGIAQALGTIFSEQQKVDEENNKDREIQDRVNQTIEKKRFESNYGILNSINQAVTRTANYTDKVNQAFQKKTLELQFRSYFVQSELLQTTSKFFEVFKNQNEAIARNTGLPEFVKINNSERFRDLARTKFMDRIQGSLFGEGSAIDRGLKRLKSDASNYIQGAKFALEGSMMGVDAVQELQELNRQLEEMGQPPISPAQIAGGQLGSFITETVAKKLTGKARDFFDKQSKVAKFGYKASAALNNIGGTIDTYRRSDKHQQRMEKGGITGAFAQASDYLMSQFMDRKPDMRIDSQAGFKGLGSASIFDNRTQKSIVEIIPGYLARVLREVNMLRTGQETSELVMFDFTTGKFASKKEVGSSIGKALAKKVKTSSYNYKLDRASRAFAGEDTRLEVDDQYKLKQFLSKISTIENMEYTPENLRKTEVYDKSDSDTKKLVDKFLKEKFEDVDEQEHLKNKAALSQGMKDVRESTPDLRSDIETMIKAGYGEILEEQGIVTIDDNGNYDINEERYYEILRKEGIVKSDVNAKTDIKPISVKNMAKSKSVTLKKRRAKSDVNAKTDIKPLQGNRAINAIKNTKLYKWFYKKGQGDDQEHTGPMAQDVRRHMGEESAPGGKSIDLVSMNGNTMAAVQELKKKQDALLESRDSKSVLMNINKDTAAIVKLLESKGAGTAGANVPVMSTVATDQGPSDNSYKSVFGSIFSNIGTLLTKSGSDLSESIQKTFKFGKDKLLTPAKDKAGELYDKHKDDVQSGAKRLMSAASDMGVRALDTAKDLIFSKFPAGLKKAAEYGNKIKDYLKSKLNDFRDVYIEGKAEPALRAALLRAGYYKDQATGKVIKTMDDLKNLKGHIVNSAGEVVLSIEEASKGLYDQYGEQIKSTASKYADMAFGFLKEGVQRGWEFAKDAGRLAKSLLGKAKDKVSEKTKGFNSLGVSFGTDKIYNVLVEMRDLMRGEKPKKHETKMKGQQNKKAQTQKPEDKKPEVAGPVKPFSIGNILGDIKSKAYDQVKALTGNISKFTNKAKDSTQTQTTVTTEETASEEPQTPEVASTEPQYRSNTNAIDTIMNAGSSLMEKIPGLKGGKAKATGALKGLATGALGRLSAGKEALKASGGFKGKSKALLGSIFSRKKKDTPDKASASQEVLNNETENQPSEDSKKTNKSRSSRRRASGARKDKATKAREGSKKVTKKTTKTGGNQKQAFNDRDGSGRRDGAWQDRLEEQKAKQEANKSTAQVASTDPKYRSEQNVIDMMLEKTSGMFSGLLGKLGGFFGIGKGGTVAGMLGKLLMSPFKLLGKGVGAVAKGIFKGGKAAASVAASVGKPVLNVLSKVPGAARIASAFNVVRTVGSVLALSTGGVGAVVGGALSALGALISSPVVIGAAVIAGVGYGAYKLYKYATRNNVSEIDAVRMIQYVGNNENVKKNYHMVLKLEDYLDDGRIGYDRGRAYLLDKKIDAQDLLDIFSIDKEDNEMVTRFMEWFQGRFKPFFLNGATALFSVNNKARVTKMNDLTPQEKIKLIPLLTFESGPYHISSSPFKDVDSLSTNDKDKVSLSFKIHLDLYKKEAEKKDKSKKPSSNAAAEIGKAAAAAAFPEASKEANKGNEEKRVQASVKPAVPPVLPKTNIGIDKQKDAKVPDIVGEDGAATNLSVPFEDEKTATLPKSGRLKYADGPIRDGARGMDYIQLSPGVKLDGLNEAMMQNFKAMAQEFGEKTGKKIPVTSGTRTQAEQEALFRKYPGKAAKPGKSLHEFGLAFDADSKTLNELEELGLMRKYGFTRPVGAEPWHVEAAGIQAAISKAKDDSNFATKAIESSLFKGGGGLGTMPNAPKYKRDTLLAQSLWDADTQTVKDAPQDKDKVNTALAPAKQVEKAKEPPKQAQTQVAAAPSTPVKPVEKKEEKKPTLQLASINNSTKSSEKYGKNNDLPDLEQKPKLALVDKGPAQDFNPFDKDDIKEEIGRIASKQNVDPKMMQTFAAAESSLNFTARAPNTSASGLYQFTKATWDEQMSKHASKHNIDPNASPVDIEPSTIMASEYVKQNMKFIQKVKPNPNLTDVYLTHFLGPEGARKFLQADPNAIAADVRPEAAKKNRTYFYDGNRPLTIRETYAKIDQRLSKTAKDFGISFQGGNTFPEKGKTAQQVPSQTTGIDAKPVNTSSITGSGKTENKPVDSTIPVSQKPQEPRKSFMTPTQATPMSPSANVAKPVDSGMNNEKLGNMDNTLSEQLVVQNKMLTALEGILQNLSEENLTKVLEAVKSPGETKTPEQTRKAPPPSAVKSTIDLRRKTA